MAGSIWIAKATLGIMPGELDPTLDPAWGPVPVTMILTVLFWGIFTPVGALLQPKDEVISDFGEIHTASPGVRAVGVGILLVASLACVDVADNAGVHLSVSLFGLMGMVLGYPVINMVVGPIVRRTSPEIWAEALVRSEDVIKESAKRSKKPISKRDRWRGVINIGLAFLFFLYVLLKLLGLWG